MDVYNLTLQDLLTVKIATNTLTDKNISTIPAPVTVFTRQDIETFGVRYLHEILEYVPGYQVTRFGAYPYEYSASSRALTFGSSSKKILFLLDGQKVNGPRSGNAAILANFTLHHVERLEIIRGPGSSIYGSNAFTGVINIITRKNTKELSIARGNEIDYDVFAAYSFQLSDYRVDLQANAVKSRGDDYELTNIFTQTPFKTDDPYQQMSLQFKVSNTKSRYQVHYREIEMENFYHTERTSNRYNFSKHSGLFLFTEHELNFLSNIDSTLSLDYVKSYLSNGNQSTPIGAFSAISEPQSDDPLYGYGEFDAYRVAASIDNHWYASERLDIQFGFEWQKNSETRANGYTNFDLSAILNQTFPIKHYQNADYTIKVGGEQSQPFYGAYVQLQTRLGEVDWILGGRLDKHPDLESQFTPRIGAVYIPTKQWQFKLLYGQAFRAPELSELTLFSGITRSGNRNLSSETIKTTDFIAQYTGDTLLVSFDFFYNEFTDPIINGQINGLVGQVNGDNEYGHGLEIELIWQLASRTRLRATATHFSKRPKSAFKDSKNLASVQLDHQFEKVQLGVSATYRSSRETPVTLSETQTLDAYWNWRGFIGYRLSDGLRLHFSVNNLLDESHYNPAITASLPDGIPLKGINGSVAITWKF